MGSNSTENSNAILGQWPQYLNVAFQKLSAGERLGLGSEANKNNAQAHVTSHMVNEASNTYAPYAALPPQIPKDKAVQASNSIKDPGQGIV